MLDMPDRLEIKVTTDTYSPENPRMGKSVVREGCRLKELPSRYARRWAALTETA